MNSQELKLELLDEITVIDQFTKDDYDELIYDRIKRTTKKAALIDDQWYPLSVLGCDPDGNLYVENWFRSKL